MKKVLGDKLGYFLKNVFVSQPWVLKDDVVIHQEAMQSIESEVTH